MIRPHYLAATGCVCIETREEIRAVRSIARDVWAINPNAEIAVMSAPSSQCCLIQQNPDGAIVNGTAIAKGMVNMEAAYEWAHDKPARVLIVHDWAPISNAPGSWRSLLSHLPLFRQPGDGSESEQGFASLVVFISPSFQFSDDNPLLGQIPILSFAPPNREELRDVVHTLHELPPGEDGERVLDALCGLTSASAEQVCSENLSANNGQWHTQSLNEARRQAIRRGGLEIWLPVSELGGLGGLKQHVQDEVIPWIRDDVLAIRRILAAGLPGTGKSYFARWLAHQIGCECARLSIPSLKSGFVGESEKNLRRALGVLDSMAAESPLVVVLDEIDTIAREGADGGTSSGMFAEMLTWLQESKSLCVVVATLNRLDKLDSALMSRFQSQMFFDLPRPAEREEVIRIHYQRCGCPLDTASVLRDITDGFSNREIAQSLIPSIARLSNRNPTTQIVQQVCQNAVSVSAAQPDQIKKMREAARSLRLANDALESASIDLASKHS